MLALDSAIWSELRHAYGYASDMPTLLQQLASFPDESQRQSGPWFELWSALCHQGDVYPASFASVPHIIAALESDPVRATMSYFLLPASIEVSRYKHGTPLPENLETAYLEALAKLPELAAQSARPNWAPELCASALAATAAATGNHQLADLIMRVEGAEIAETLEWLENR